MGLRYRHHNVFAAVLVAATSLMLGDSDAAWGQDVNADHLEPDLDWQTSSPLERSRQYPSASPVGAGAEPGQAVKMQSDVDTPEKTDRSPISEGGLVSLPEQGKYLSQGLDRAQLHDPAVRAALSRVPRHRFVPKSLESEAYSDKALSIGQGQTISQPYIVALMTENAGVHAGSRVLEIGTGSGYQSAVLAELGARVFTIEIIPELSHRAESVLRELGYEERISFRIDDGSGGWEDEAPFDAIIVTAAAPSIPAKLLTQLAVDGRLVIPLEEKTGPLEENIGEGGGDDGQRGRGERLMVIEKRVDRLVTRDLGGVRFVPLTGEIRQLAAQTGSDYPAVERGLGIVPSNNPVGRIRPK